MSQATCYGIVGCGARANQLVRYLAARKDEAALKAMCEPSDMARADLMNAYGPGDIVCYDDYRDMLADGDISWVLVMSPNFVHREHIVAAFQAGKHVFAEKPLATSIEDCVAINDAHAAAEGLVFATGFVLRYAPLYRKVKELLAAGAIGRVVAIDADENITPPHSGHVMTCWRRFTKYSGSHMLEKCCHDMDLLNWFTESLPARVASFGGLNIFTPANAELMHKFTPAAGEPSIYLEWYRACRDTQDPFNTEKDIADNQVAILEYRSGVRATFQTVMNNAIPERRMYISGTEGTMIAELYGGRLDCRRIGKGQETRTWDFSGDMHGGGDKYIADSIVDMMAGRARPECSGEEGLLSAVVSLAVEQARHTGTVIDLQPTWQRLGLQPQAMGG